MAVVIVFVAIALDLGVRWEQVQVVVQVAQTCTQFHEAPLDWGGE